MALIPFLGRRNNLWDVPDPMEVMVTLFDNTPASSFARDAHAVASTNVDWKETPKEHVFKADLPGLKKEEVKVQVEDDRTLSISGQRKKEEVQKTDTWHRVERSTGSFMRKFRLPENVQLDKITAKCENGVLTVTVPKLEKTHPKPRTIEIGGHDTESQQQQPLRVENNQPSEHIQATEHHQDSEYSQSSEHNQPSEHIQATEHHQASEHSQSSEHNQPAEHKSA